MKGKIYNVFDWLVVLMMIAAILNLAIVDGVVPVFVLIGLIIFGGLLLEVSFYDHSNRNTGSV